MRRLLLLSVSSVLVFSACSQNIEVRDIRDSIRPEIKRDEVGPETGKNGQTKPAQFNVSIEKSDLGTQLYLLQNYVIQQKEIPQFNGGRTRLVYFVQRGSKIVMRESSEGQAVSKDLPQNLALATFNTVSETADKVTFDWNEGMGRLFVASDWKAQDLDGSRFNSDYEFVDVVTSYIDETQYVDNSIVIRQVAQASVTGPAGKALIPVEAKYILSPYVRNLDFKPTVSKDMKTFGFFEVAPRFDEHGGTVIHASKFDIKKKPVVFAISANTPAEYRDAIKRGVLYWNKTHPGLIEVTDAPAGVTAPDVRYNLVQWVDWEAAGFAYADGVMDPLTGENLRANVFMTSVFAVASRARVLQKLARLKSGTTQPVKAIRLNGLSDDPLCSLDHSQKLISGLQNLANSNADDATILRVSQDYVTEVVAHEIGHTLGFRHNFAGNLATNFDLKDRSSLFEKYVTSDDVAESLIPSSSVMEYSAFEEASFVGAKIRKGQAALSYDQMAVRALYEGAKFSRSEVPTFCTDSALKPYIDCKQFDVGRTFVEYSSWFQADIFSSLPNSILETYVRFSKAVVVPGSEVPVEEIGLDLSPLLDQIVASRKGVLSALSGGQIWAVRRQFPAINMLNEEAVAGEEQDYLAKEISRLGGLQNVIQAVPADFVSVQTERFNKLLDSGVYNSGVSATGQAWSFTADELKVIRERGQLYIQKLYEELMKRDVAALVGLTNIPESRNQGEVVSLLQNRVERYVFELSDKPATVVTVKNRFGIDVQLNLVQFAYPQELRIQAAGLLKENRFKGFEVTTAERTALLLRFQQLVEAAVGKRAELDPATLPKEARLWFKQVWEIESAL